MMEYLWTLCQRSESLVFEPSGEVKVNKGFNFRHVVYYVRQIANPRNEPSIITLTLSMKFGLTTDSTLGSDSEKKRDRNMADSFF